MPLRLKPSPVLEAEWSLSCCLEAGNSERRGRHCSSQMVTCGQERWLPRNCGQNTSHLETSL
eukprot:5952513-Amphidinium_carterae.1